MNFIPNITQQLPPARWEDLVALWSSLEDLRAAQVDDGWRTVCERMGAMVNSHGGLALLYARQPEGMFHGWQPLRQLDHGEGRETRLAINMKWAANPECLTDPYALALFEQAGTPRAYRSTDLAPTEEERNASPSFALLGEHGLADRMIMACVVSPDVEVHFGFDRRASEPMFSEADRDIARAAANMLSRTCRWLALAYGVYPRNNPLTTRERDVLSGLLRGDSEKQIADALGLRTTSTHQVVVRVYRKLGVRKRSELMALWLTDKPALGSTTR